LSSSFLQAQLQYKGTEKLCIDGEVSKLLYIEYVSNVIVAQVYHPNRLVALNTTNGSQLWLKPLQAGFGVKANGNQKS